MVYGGVSTNHVGERRNFCFAKIRRPVLENVVQFIVHILHGCAASRCGLSGAPAPTHLCRFFSSQNRWCSLRILLYAMG